MNILMNLSEALQSANEMDRESTSILGFCSETQKTATRRADDYTVYLRRRNRYRRAA
jgi:hypothetical protein